MRRITQLLAAAATCLTAQAQAQNIDYAGLAQLFGEPVTTSVTGKPQKASEAPASLIIITQDDIGRSPGSNVPAILKAYAGIDVVRWSAAQSDVTVRGGVQPWDPRLLVLVNGRQVYLDHYGMTSWRNLGVQLEEIEQIEVVKGPNGALFGFNAVAGVVNIITADPLHSRYVRVTAEGGTDEYLRSSAVVAVQPAAGVGLRLSAGYEQAREFDKTLKDPGYAAGPASTIFRRKDVGGEATLQLSDRLVASLSASHAIRSGYDVPPPAIAYMKYTTSSVGGSLTQDMDWGMVSARVYQNWLKHEDAAGALMPVDGVYDNRVFVAAADAVVSTSSRQTIRAGLEYRSNELFLESGAGTRYRIYAVSGMVEQKLAERLTFTLAGRADHMRLARTGSYQGPAIFSASDYDRQFTSWSMNSALLLALDDTSSLRVSGGRGVQAPSLMNLGWSTLRNSGGATPVLLSGNPYLDPAVTWSGEIAYSRKLRLLDARMDVAVFYRDTRELYDLSLSPASSPYRPPDYPFIGLVFDQRGALESYGLEASLSGEIGPSLRWGLNYSWNAVAEKAGGGAVNQLAFDTTTPRHKANLRLSSEQGRWKLSTLLRYVSKTEQIVPFLNGNLSRVPGHVGIDGRIGYALDKRAELYVTAENLTDAGHFFNAERRFPAGVRRGF